MYTLLIRYRYFLRNCCNCLLSLSKSATSLSISNAEKKFSILHMSVSMPLQMTQQANNYTFLGWIAYWPGWRGDMYFKILCTVYTMSYSVATTSGFENIIIIAASLLPHNYVPCYGWPSGAKIVWHKIKGEEDRFVRARKLQRMV